jgi:hypothetical protein
VRVARTIAEHGALGAPSGLGILLAAFWRPEKKAAS